MLLRGLLERELEKQSQDLATKGLLVLCGALGGGRGQKLAGRTVATGAGGEVEPVEKTDGEVVGDKNIH